MGLLLDVKADGWLSTNADPAVGETLGLDAGLIYTAALVITFLGNSWVLVPIVFLASYVLARRGLRDDAWVLALGSFVTIGLVWLVKWLVGRERPGAPGSWDAFPSGHAANGVAVFGLLFFLAFPWPPRGPDARGPDMRPFVATAAAALLMGGSRLLLDVHWFTDVVAGWTFGLAALAGALWLRRAARTSPQM